MDSTQQTSGPIQRASASIVTSFLNQVYMWMVGGLATTALIALLLSQQFKSNPDLIDTVSALILPVFLVELGIVVWISARAGKMSTTKASVLFLLYSGLNGLFFSIVLASYATDVVAITFLATTLTFAAMAMYGQTTKQDLSKFGSLAYMGLIGLIIGSIINIFAQSEFVYWVVTYLGIGVFIVLIAYDSQKLKALATQAEMTGEPVSKYAINGALMLYLDFINLFILLLRVFSGGRD